MGEGAGRLRAGERQGVLETSGIEPESEPTAVAPPNGPMTPGECQPRARIDL